MHLEFTALGPGASNVNHEITLLNRYDHRDQYFSSTGWRMIPICQVENISGEICSRNHVLSFSLSIRGIYKTNYLTQL